MLQSLTQAFEIAGSVAIWICLAASVFLGYLVIAKASRFYVVATNESLGRTEFSSVILEGNSNNEVEKLFLVPKRLNLFDGKHQIGFGVKDRLFLSSGIESFADFFGLGANEPVILATWRATYRQICQPIEMPCWGLAAILERQLEYWRHVHPDPSGVNSYQSKIGRFADFKRLPGDSGTFLRRFNRSLILVNNLTGFDQRFVHSFPLLVRYNRLHDDGEKNEQAKGVLSNEVERLPKIINNVRKPEQQNNARPSSKGQATNEGNHSPIKHQPSDRRSITRKVLIVFALESVCALVGAICLFHLLNLRKCNTKSLDRSDKM